MLSFLLTIVATALVVHEDGLASDLVHEPTAPVGAEDPEVADESDGEELPNAEVNALRTLWHADVCGSRCETSDTCQCCDLLLNHAPCAWHGVECRGGHVVRLGAIGSCAENLGSVDISAVSGLTYLEALDLSSLGEVVQGSLSSLTELVHLQSIELYGSDVKGSLTELSGLQDLKKLDLGEALNVRGELSTLAPLLQLEVLNLRGTLVEGDVDALAAHTKLIDLDLYSCSDLKGDLSALAALTQLTHLDLGRVTNLEGYLSSLAGLVKLEHLNLAYVDKVQGFLLELANLTKLETLFLYGLPRVTGELSDLAGLIQLDAIRLQHTGVYGRLRGLATLEKLSTLYLHGTDVGNANENNQLSELQSLVHLKTLNLDGCDNVRGNVSELSPLVELVELDLSYTEAGGDVAGLAPLVQLQELRLGHTKVGGDIGGLSGLVHLQQLELFHCEEVTGNINTLLPLKELEHLELVASGVSRLKKEEHVPTVGDLQALRKTQAETEASAASTSKVSEQMDITDEDIQIFTAKLVRRIVRMKNEKDLDAALEEVQTQRTVREMWRDRRQAD